MARLPVVQQSAFPYFVTARCINREWFNIPMEIVWNIMSSHLTFVWHAYGGRTLGFVLMSNHWHLLINTPQSNISEILLYFMANTSRDLTRAGNRINQTYGGRNYKTILSTENYYLNAHKYLYQNPVKAGICKKVEDYRFSSLHGLLGFSHQPFPVAEDTTLFSDVEGTVKWLNKSPIDEDWDTMRNALHRPNFRLPKDPNTKKPHRLETGLI